MILLDYLDKIRSYPEERRRRLLLVSTFSITLAIILVWLLNIWLVTGYIGRSGAEPGFLARAIDELKHVISGLEAVVDIVRGLWR